MNNDIPCKSNNLLYLFIFQMCLNWLYVIWVQLTSNTIASSWLTILPLLAYFYFSFTFVASIELYHKTKLGFSLAYAVITFGIISAVMSYSLVFKESAVFGIVIVPLIALNFLVVLIMVVKQKKYIAQ